MAVVKRNPELPVPSKHLFRPSIVHRADPNAPATAVTHAVPVVAPPAVLTSPLAVKPSPVAPAALPVQAADLEVPKA